jgi:hypothetical protein
VLEIIQSQFKVDVIHFVAIKLSSFPEIMQPNNLRQWFRLDELITEIRQNPFLK